MKIEEARLERLTGRAEARDARGQEALGPISEGKETWPTHV